MLLKTTLRGALLCRVLVVVALCASTHALAGMTGAHTAKSWAGYGDAEGRPPPDCFLHREGTHLLPKRACPPAMAPVSNAGGGFNVSGARAAGYSDDAIVSYLQQLQRSGKLSENISGALKAGYSPTEIDNFLDHGSVAQAPTTTTADNTQPEDKGLSIGEDAFNLMGVAALLASLFLWLIGSMWVVYALFKPRKVAANRKGIRVLIAYFINAGLWGFAYCFPAATDTVLKAAKSAFVSSTPYAEGTLALAFMVFVWVSPIVVVGGIVWLAFSLLASMTASEVVRRQQR